MPTIHVVKSWSMFFQDILSGERTSDIRKNDRRYTVGDILRLTEFNPVTFEYTGRSQDVIITYLQQNKSNPCAISREALAQDYVVLSIRRVPKKVPGMAVQALASEIVAALLADEKSGGYDLTGGMFGTEFSKLVSRWAAAEYYGNT